MKLNLSEKIFLFGFIMLLILNICVAIYSFCAYPFWDAMLVSVFLIPIFLIELFLLSAVVLTKLFTEIK